MKKIKVLLFLFFTSISLFAVTAEIESDSVVIDSLMEEIDSVALWQAALKYETNTIQLANGVAELKVPKGYKYLNAADSRKLMMLWGNPDDPSSLGLLLKEDESPLTGTSYIIEISYQEEGYVEDDDAEDIDYEEMLVQLKEEATASNVERKAQGFPTVSLVGWAAVPFYDAENKKLHWAKELKFEGEEANTLNYNIRILGRKGYLMLNAIGDIKILPDVNKDLKGILNGVNFTPGNKYEDFDSSIDEVAVIGIGGLIAGKALAKVGLWAVFAKFFKFIIFGIIALFAAFKNKIFGLFKKKEKVEETQVVNTPSTPEQLP